MTGLPAAPSIWVGEGRSSAAGGGAQVGIGPTQAATALGSCGVGTRQWTGAPCRPGPAATPGPAARAREPDAAHRDEADGPWRAVTHRSRRPAAERKPE